VRIAYKSFSFFDFRFSSLHERSLAKEGQNPERDAIPLWFFSLLLINLKIKSLRKLHNRMKIWFLCLLFIFLSAPLNAQDSRENFKFAKYNYDNKNFQEAIKFLDIALKEDDQYPNAYLLRAESYYALGQYYNAILDINRIFTIDNSLKSSASDFYLIRGKSYLALDEYTKAHEDLQNAALYSKTNAQAHYFLGRLWFETRNYDESLWELDTATAIDPQQGSFYALRAEVMIARYKPGKGSDAYRDVISDLDMAIALDENNEHYYYIRGQFLKNMGEMERAMQDFDATIRLSPKEERAYTNRGLIKMNQYQFQGAVLDFTRSILLNPQVESNYRYRGLCYNNLNNLREAYKDFSKSIEMLTSKFNDTAEADLVKNTLAETYVLRGHCLNLMGNNSLACSDFLAAHNLGMKKGLNYYRKYCGIY
jgi:tetratricopeptide (TPR) repeat protein